MPSLRERENRAALNPSSLLTVVGLGGLGGDRCGRVTMLHVTGCGRHYAAGCARREA